MGIRQSKDSSDVQERLKLSVVIPTLNESASVGAAIQSTRNGQQHSAVEVVVVDCGSSDNTVSIAKQNRAKVLHSKRGRGLQLNAGWRAARGDWVLFLHGDCVLPPNYTRLIDNALHSQPPQAQQPQWGCFSSIQTDLAPPLAALLRGGVELRTRLLGMPYGDQGIFVRRSCLERIGGLPDWPLLEDVELVRRLAGESRPAVVARPLHTSSRRWKRLGFWRACLVNQGVLLGWKAGVDVHDLAQWYYGQR